MQFSDNPAKILKNFHLLYFLRKNPSPKGCSENQFQEHQFFSKGALTVRDLLLLKVPMFLISPPSFFEPLLTESRRKISQHCIASCFKLTKK